ncbi:hypothetical protein MMC14_007535 [Varicellaria rhodocarpa]|nr:hypothetical protein [Varicellaria rhodocarpa]
MCQLNSLICQTCKHEINFRFDTCNAALVDKECEITKSVLLIPFNGLAVHRTLNNNPGFADMQSVEPCRFCFGKLLADIKERRDEAIAKKNKGSDEVGEENEGGDEVDYDGEGGGPETFSEYSGDDVEDSEDEECSDYSDGQKLREELNRDEEVDGWMEDDRNYSGPMYGLETIWEVDEEE